ncbi:MAG: hypothetical protein AB1631_09480 [Acidobacteriota bacterium]
MAAELPTPNIYLTPDSTLASRLKRVVSETAREIASSPIAYLRAAFLPERGEEWFPVRLGDYLVDAARALVRHPLTFIRESRRPDFIGERRGRTIRWTLVSSLMLHSVLLVYLIYVAIAPFLGITIVDKEYRKFDADKILKQLHYPPGMLRITLPRSTMTLEEIRAREKKRHEEAKARKEKEERERLRREKEEQERIAREQKAEEERKAAEEAAKKPCAEQIGELNLAPIKDLVGKIYNLHGAGQLGLQESKLNVMIGFRIDPDGAISKITVVKSSGVKLIDKYSAEIIWNIGESHALGMFCKLSSTTVALDLNDQVARLTITGFAPTPDVAADMSAKLNTLFKFVAWNNKKSNPPVAELMSLVRVRSNGKRLDAELAVSRERADAMMREQFGKTPGTPQ